MGFSSQLPATVMLPNREHLCDQGPGPALRCQAVRPSQGQNQCPLNADSTKDQEREASCLKLLVGVASVGGLSLSAASVRTGLFAKLALRINQERG